MQNQTIVQTAAPVSSPVRLQFSHETNYQYSGPVSFGIHRLVLRPRESHFERLEFMNVTTSPPSQLHWYQDIYGNIIATAKFSQTASQLVIRSEFTIAKTALPTWVAEDGGPITDEYPAYYAGIEEAASHLYRLSVYPPEVEQIREWVRSLGILPPVGQRAPIFSALAKKIHEQISYLRREEPGVRSPSKTLALASGSCRDVAVLMMEAARCIGYAARFVSGYFESANSKVGIGSTHAWTEVYLPDRGWVGYDPSIGEPVGIGHVAVAMSHHPRGVMPITGKFDSFGQRALGMTVGIQSNRF